MAKSTYSKACCKADALQALEMLQIRGFSSSAKLEVKAPLPKSGVDQILHLHKQKAFAKYPVPRRSRKGGGGIKQARLTCKLKANF